MTGRLAVLLLAAHSAGAAPPARQLAVVNVVTQQFEDGPAASTFQTGETVYLSFQISGYQVSDAYRILLTCRMEARDAQGLPLAPPVARKLDTELADEDKNWMPKLRYEVLVPPLAEPGSYQLRIHVKDELSGSEASKELTFEVRGLAVEPSPTLVLRNFRFLRGEEDAKPLAPAAYRPGDSLWARFEITGYKLGEKNRFQVEYGVSVCRPSSEVLYSEPNAASEQDESFYPKRYTPGILSVRLDPDVAKAEYIIVVTVRDLIGGQKYEERHSFRVE